MEESAWPTFDLIDQLEALKKDLLKQIPTDRAITEDISVTPTLYWMFKYGYSKEKIFMIIFDDHVIKEATT